MADCKNRLRWCWPYRPLRRRLAPSTSPVSADSTSPIPGQCVLLWRLPATLPEGDEGLQIASKTMKGLGDRLDDIPQASMEDFYILLVDRRLWTRYYVETYSDGKAYNTYVHTAAPEEDIPIALMTYEVLDALNAGKMTIADALDAGVLQIQGNRPGQISAALDLAYAADLAGK